MTVPDSVSVVIDPSADDGFASSSGTVTVTTNSANGYTLFYTAGSTSLTNSTANSDSTHATFSSISADGSDKSAFSSGQWGLYVGNSYANTFNKVTTDQTQVAITSTNNTTADSYTMAVGAKADTHQVAGSYGGTVTLLAVVNAKPGLTYYNTLEDAYAKYNASTVSWNGKNLYTMQGMTKDICGYATTPGTSDDGNSLQVVDTRDNKLYWISKLADGNCWMTQNLDLDLSSSTALTSANTDVTADWTPTNSTITGSGNTASAYTDTYNSNGLSSVCSGWTNSSNNPYSCNNGDYYYDVSVSGTSATGDKVSSSALTSSDVLGNTKIHYHVGNFYNWSAAVASNDTSGTASGSLDTSICPKGWDLPIGSSSSDSKSWYHLISTTYAYGNNSTGSANASKAPLYFLRAGYVDGGTLYNSGYYGYLWSSTAGSDSYAYGAGWHPSYLSPGTDNGGRYYGQSVRCVAAGS